MAIRITSKQEGFRRAGIAHPKEPTYYPDDRFTPAELKQLKADPVLDVKKVADKDVPPDALAPPIDPAERQAELDRQADELEKRTADLVQREEGLKEAEKGLAKRNKALDEREAALGKREAEAEKKGGKK